MLGWVEFISAKNHKRFIENFGTFVCNSCYLILILPKSKINEFQLHASKF